MDIGFTQENITGRRNMRRIYKNKSKNCPFSDDFLEGFNSGTEVQFEADVKVLKEIKAEIEELKGLVGWTYEDGVGDCQNIIDKHISGKENE